jgi:hypothetical protein
MLTRNLLLGAAASLLAGGAFAQQTNPPVVDMPIGAQTGKLVPKAEGAPAVAPQPTGAPTSAVLPDIASKPGETTPYVSDAVSGPTAGAQVITNGPVPDTAANRRMYRPMSRAGQRTAPAGN